MLLLHDWSGSGSQPGGFVHPLVKAGYSVWSHDAPGHGQKGRGLTGVPEMAQALEQVASVAGQVHSIVAHSLGSMACTIAMSRGLEVGRVVFVAPPENPGAYLSLVARQLGFTEFVCQRAMRQIEQRFMVRFEQLRGVLLATNLATPLLIFHDELDREVAFEVGQRFAEAWPAARLIASRDLGHSRILWVESVIEQSVHFIGKVASVEAMPQDSLTWAN